MDELTEQERKVLEEKLLGIAPGAKVRATFRDLNADDENDRPEVAIVEAVLTGHFQHAKYRHLFGLTLLNDSGELPWNSSLRGIVEVL